MNETNWSAQWIDLGSEPDLSRPNTWTCFRRSVDLPDRPGSAKARIAVDSKYWLWVNGELVVFEGGLKRGPTPDGTYYDEVDLAEHLVRGVNTIAVLLWYFGKDGFSHSDSGKAGMVLEADLDGEKLLSDSTWRVRPHPAYGDTGEPHPNNRLPESNIRFDARDDILGWHLPKYDDSDWEEAAELGVPPTAPWGRLVKRPIPLWKNYGRRDYANAADLPNEGGEAIVARLPYNAQVTPYLKVDAPAGLTIDLRTDADRVGTQECLRAEYVTREGVQEYESLGWLTGHEVRYTIPAGVKILGLKFRETGYDTDFAGSFSCDDDFYNKLWEKALRTLYITMRDTYMDCPDRERAQWWGDEVNELGEAFYALCPKSHGLAKKGIHELMNWQREDKTVYSPVPSGNYDRELPTQMLASVGWYGFWTYYLHTGDADTIRDVYPRVRDYLGIWELGDDGLVVPRAGGWTWGDWGEEKDMTVLFNCWYYLALKTQVAMAQLAGRAEDIAAIQANMRSIEANFNGTFWTGSAYRSAEYDGETDDRANALAVVVGLADPPYHDAIREVLQTEYHASPYMEKYVLEALYLMRYEGDALARMKKRYGPMVESHLTTLWEGWDLSNRGWTVNHAWTGGPLTLLSQYAAGVAPVEPGYETYQVLPQMGALKSVQVCVPSIKGNIEARLRREGDTFRLDLTSPPGTSAVAGIPKPAETIAANGQAVWQQRPLTHSVDGLAYEGEDEHYYRFTVAPGTWAFTAS